MQDPVGGSLQFELGEVVEELGSGLPRRRDHTGNSLQRGESRRDSPGLDLRDTALLDSRPRGELDLIQPGGSPQGAQLVAEVQARLFLGGQRGSRRGRGRTAAALATSQPRALTPPRALREARWEPDAERPCRRAG